jgi:hypothetical protein
MNSKNPDKLSLFCTTVHVMRTVSEIQELELRKVKLNEEIRQLEVELENLKKRSAQKGDVPDLLPAPRVA